MLSQKFPEKSVWHSDSDASPNKPDFFVKIDAWNYMDFFGDTLTFRKELLLVITRTFNGDNLQIENILPKSAAFMGIWTLDICFEAMEKSLEKKYVMEKSMKCYEKVLRG
jgi:hypothetical protein